MDMDFDSFTQPLIGLPVSNVWRGHGSALFLEFGALDAPRVRKDGSAAPAGGQMSLMVEWSWRIEGRHSIIAGSWSDERTWSRAFRCLTGATVREAKLFGRLPEIELVLSNDARLLSFNSPGDPCWMLFDRRRHQERWCGVRLGALQLGRDRRSEDARVHLACDGSSYV